MSNAGRALQEEISGNDDCNLSDTRGETLSVFLTSWSLMPETWWVLYKHVSLEWMNAKSPGFGEGLLGSVLVLVIPLAL